MPTPIWIGMVGRKAPPASSAILRMAAAGGGRAGGGGGGGPAAVVAGERAIEIDLPARQHAVEARVLAEFKIGNASELEPLLFRPVLEFELLHQRRCRGGLDLAAHVPRLV